METSVSLLIMTRLKIAPDGPEELVAVLQKRGEFNHETMGPESWAGACQLTVHGKVEPNENEKSTLQRETIEELGGNFICDGRAWEAITVKMVEIGRVDKPGKSIVHYATEVPPAKLASFRLNASTGGLRLVAQSDLQDIQGLPNFNANKTDGVFARRTIAMFPDEIEALKKAFAIFGDRPVPCVEVQDEVLHAEHLRKMNGV